MKKLPDKQIGGKVFVSSKNLGFGYEPVKKIINAK